MKTRKVSFIIQFFVFVLLFFLPAIGETAQKLTFGTEGVVVYSGPSQRFRPLIVGKKGQRVTVSPRIMIGADGLEYYKVLLKMTDGEKRVGYVLSDAEVELDQATAQEESEEEELESYKEFALAESALQINFQALKDSNYLWTIGYLKYPAPDFYIKIYTGQLLNKLTGSPVLAAEVGIDQIVVSQFSFFAFFGTGAVFLPIEGAVFEGSKSLSMLTQGGAGIRYNADQYAAVGIGLIQTAIYSPNNSFLSVGAGLSLEVGI